MKIVVIGGSITGCMAAEILTRHFDDVTIVDKGNFSLNSSERVNIPQEKHAHVVLLKGMMLIKDIYPDILDKLKASGAPYSNLGEDIDWMQYNEWKVKYKSQYGSYFFSRNLLDSIIRKETLGNKKIRVLRNTSVDGLIVEPHDSKKKITGLRVSNQSGSTTLPADLVIDCSGFGSRTVGMLQDVGINRPVITQINKNLGYASRVYKALPGYENKAIVIWSSEPEDNAIGLLLPIENNRYVVSVGGCFSKHPQADELSYLSFMKNLPTDQLYSFVRKLEPLSDIHTFKYPGSTWTHFEDLDDLPDGLLVAGAALCAVNPFYGQGITICAKQIDVIDKNINKWKKNKIKTIKIQKMFNKTIATSWKMAEVEDFRHKNFKKKVTPLIEFLQWYGKHFAITSNHDYYVREAQFKIIHMISNPFSIFHPRIIIKIIMNSLKKKDINCE